MDFAVPVDHREKKERKRKETQVRGPPKRTKKFIDHENDDVTNFYLSAWNEPQKFGKGIQRIVNQKTNQDHPDYNIVEIGQNSEKTPGNLRRLTVTPSSVKNHQQTLLWKTRKEYNNNNNNLWDCVIQTDTKINNRRDIVIQDLNRKISLLILLSLWTDSWQFLSVGTYQSKK